MIHQLDLLDLALDLFVVLVTSIILSEDCLGVLVELRKHLTVLWTNCCVKWLLRAVSFKAFGVACDT